VDEIFDGYWWQCEKSNYRRGRKGRSHRTLKTRWESLDSMLKQCGAFEVWRKGTSY
jgi:hypothetical protein